MINGHPGKTVLVCSLCFLCCRELVAFSIPLPHISISPYTEVSIGEAREYVYYDDKILSELIWDMKPMTSIGLTADVGWKRGLQLFAEFSAGIPADTGSMQDSDWLNVQYPDVPNWKTNYSKHDEKLDFAYQASIKAGWEFETPVKGIASEDPITVVPLFGFRYMTWKWDGLDGYGYEQPNAPYDITVNGKTETGYSKWQNATKMYFEGKVISYQQEYWMPEAEVSVSIPVVSNFRIDLGISGSVWVWCNDLDTHHVTNINYYDTMSAGWLIEPQASVHWNLFSKISFFLDGRWTLIDGLYGDTGQQSTSGGAITWSDGSVCGAGLNTVSIRFGIETKIVN